MNLKKILKPCSLNNQSKNIGQGFKPAKNLRFFFPRTYTQMKARGNLVFKKENPTMKQSFIRAGLCLLVFVFIWQSCSKDTLLGTDDQQFNNFTSNLLLNEICWCCPYCDCYPMPGGECSMPMSYQLSYTGKKKRPLCEIDTVSPNAEGKCPRRYTLLTFKIVVDGVEVESTDLCVKCKDITCRRPKTCKPRKKKKWQDEDSYYERAICVCEE